MKKKSGSPSLIDLVELWLVEEKLPYTLTTSGVLHKSSFQAGESMWPIGQVESNGSAAEPLPHVSFVFEGVRIIAADPEFFIKLRAKLS